MKHASNSIIVGVVRDTVYIDGGNLCYLAGLNDGSYGEGSPDCPGMFVRQLQLTH